MSQVTKLVVLTGEVVDVDSAVADIMNRKCLVVESCGSVVFSDSVCRYLRMDKVRKVFTSAPRAGTQAGFNFDMISASAPAASQVK